MKNKGSGWRNESRRHSLARRGISTVSPSSRQFVAGGSVEDKIDEIDIKYRIDNYDYDSIISKIVKIIDTHTGRLENTLFELGFSEDEVDAMQIRTYIQEEVNEVLASDFLMMGADRNEDLFEWILDRVDLSPTSYLYNRNIDQIDASTCDNLNYEINEIYKSDLSNTMGRIIKKATSDLKSSGFSDDDIADMYIADWQGNVFFGKLNRAVGGIPDYFTQETTLYDLVSEIGALDMEGDVL